MKNAKLCTKCKRVKALSQFSHDKAKKDGLSYKCKDCVKEYNNNYRLRGNEKPVEKAVKSEWNRVHVLTKLYPNGINPNEYEKLFIAVDIINKVTD